MNTFPFFFASQRTPNSLHCFVTSLCEIACVENPSTDCFHPDLNIFAMTFVLFIISDWKKWSCMFYLKDLHSGTFSNVFKQTQLNP